ncbi:MerR family transcriptional regulator [Pseudodesulfovibrio sp. F-1]|uniref:MerR family transcriptional regulator n=1 Tax=Pseudodesulfovibrio alkaliphilus TaxID=2661613 RepID=A0A7K1KNI7_9BACT|nr:MerR family transcriptional regulator [Pseudodesulfovibrio alkaliphilus]MUM77560.1 MerR family transcriptional regulator [Pseudodesulfovibrio alkaliphilus]
MEEAYTHKDLAALCKVSETTIKSYRRKFPGFIPVLTHGKPIRFRKEAADVCLRIRDCFDKGMSVNETRKTLKEHFRESPAERRRVAQPSRSEDASPEVAGAGVVSQEYLDKFFATAGQMMQGMAGLATAQAKAGQRLQALETAMQRLIEVQQRNNETFTLLLERTTPASDTLAASSSTDAGGGAGPKADSGGPTTPPPVRARKVVNVTSPGGGVKSYTLEKSEAPGATNSGRTALERPSDAFLNTPIVIRNDQGEFLGVPGRMSLGNFVEVMVREAEESGASLSDWHRDEDTWIFTMQTPGGDAHALHFVSTTTPRGNLVVLLDRLDVNGEQTSPRFLQEFFRQVKDKI